MNGKLAQLADIIAAVRSPLGFFVLVALTTQAVLILLAQRAVGFNLTLLIVGMILTLVLLVVIVYVQGRDTRKSTQTRQNVESAVGSEEIHGDFEKIKPYIDWQKFSEAVVAWGRQNKAKNAWDMGPKNYLRCLYDLGIPGGKRFELKREPDGTLIYQ